MLQPIEDREGPDSQEDKHVSAETAGDGRQNLARPTSTASTSTASTASTAAAAASSSTSPCARAAG